MNISVRERPSASIHHLVLGAYVAVMACVFAQDHGGSGGTAIVGEEAEAQPMRITDRTIPSSANKLSN